MTWIVVIGSTVLMWVWVIVYSFFPSADFIDEAFILFGTVPFWTTVVLTVAICLGVCSSIFVLKTFCSPMYAAPRFLIKYFKSVYLPLDKDLVREMWVIGDLKDQLGIGHRRDKNKRPPQLTNASSLESAPILNPHNASLSDIRYADSPSPLTQPSKYLDSPPMAEAHELTTRETSQYATTPPHVSNNNNLLSPNPAPTDLRASPSPSYYSVSELPPPSPMPETTYRYPSGEVTNSPPPSMSRRGSQASRMGTSPHAPPNAPLPPSPPSLSTSQYQQQHQPPSSFQQNLHPTSARHGREPSNASTQYTHAFERSGSSASYTSNASFATAREPTWDQNSQFSHSNNPYHQYGHSRQPSEVEDPYGGIAVNPRDSRVGGQADDQSTVHGHQNTLGLRPQYTPRESVASTWEGGKAL